MSCSSCFWIHTTASAAIACYETAFRAARSLQEPANGVANTGYSRNCF
jgi:uncharacterized glyoxalase superfamily protein PhnB